ncbi:hypothetical protein C0J52_12734 [Blattella germanica]|nr:hypothetical protein C0J52_12734 [Blattella germanica]
MCIAGRCRVVGCDWLVDSSAVEDRCGICKGDGSQCTVIEVTYTQVGKDYVNITVIPKGSTRIFIEELKPTPNTLALASSNGRFFLNIDHTEEHDQEFHVAGTVGYYVHPENELERIVISGPTSEDIILFACFNSKTNPGILYKFAKRLGYRRSSEHMPNYHWEFVSWNECSRRCNEGTQVSEPSCVEETDGKVDDSFCVQAMKPEPKIRLCNQKPCLSFWKTGEWRHCTGCLNKAGTRVRQVECARESPYEDESIVTDDKYCSGPKPHQTEPCKSYLPCHNHTRKQSQKYIDNSPMRSTNYEIENAKIMINIVKASNENCTIQPTQMNTQSIQEHTNINKTLRGENKHFSVCDDAHQKEVISDSIVKDVIPENLLDLVEIPIVQNKNEFVLSDEASEALGDKLSEVVNEKEKKEFIGEEAEKLLKGDVKDSSNENATNSF